MKLVAESRRDLFGFRELAVDICFDSFTLPFDGAVHHKHDAAVALVMVVQPQTTPVQEGMHRYTTGIRWAYYTLQMCNTFDTIFLNDQQWLQL